MVFGVQHPDGRKLHSCFDIRRLKPQKIQSYDDYSVRDTVLNWRLSFKDFFRLIDKGMPSSKSGAERSGSGAEHSEALWTIFSSPIQPPLLPPPPSGVFELIIYTSVKIAKRLEQMLKDDRQEISADDLLSLEQWTCNIVRIPDRYNDATSF